MFKNLFNLSVKRSGFEIFGFYIFYSLLGAIVAGVVCGVMIAALHPEVKTVEDAMAFAIKYAPIMAIFYGLVLSFLLMNARKLFSSFKAVSLVILSIPLLFFCGLSLGLVPVAFLTGIEDNETPEQKD